MDGLAIFNSLEACFWISVAAIVFNKSFRDSRFARLGTITSGWFALFGISDIFEVFTGAWWRPWPLLALKATCVTALVICGTLYRRRSQLSRVDQVIKQSVSDEDRI